MRIDLHCHSTVSDGSHPPAEVMRRARAAGIDVVALTDHDTQAGHEEARRALPAGLTLVPGMELSCRLHGHSVHLLAYHADPRHPGLAAQCRDLVTDRLRRAQEMAAKLRALGTGITWEQVLDIAAGGVVGRPHLARALVAAGVVATVNDAFTPEWIGVGGRAYVTHHALDPVAAIALVRAASGVTVLAHPGVAARGWRVSDDDIARLADAGLAGLEVAHPDHDEAERARLADLATGLGLVATGGSDDDSARRADAGLAGLEVAHPDHDEAERARLADLATGLGLVATGGSDDHGAATGDRIGSATTEPEAYERLMALAGRGSAKGGG